MRATIAWLVAISAPLLCGGAILAFYHLVLAHPDWFPTLFYFFGAGDEPISLADFQLVLGFVAIGLAAYGCAAAMHAALLFQRALYFGVWDGVKTRLWLIALSIAVGVAATIFNRWHFERAGPGGAYEVYEGVLPLAAVSLVHGLYLGGNLWGSRSSGRSFLVAVAFWLLTVLGFVGAFRLFALPSFTADAFWGISDASWRQPPWFWQAVALAIVASYLQFRLLLKTCE